MDGNYDAPISHQEIWAAGVTYQRSKEARMDEAKKYGGDVFYDKVYDAARPDIFFKATANRTVGNNEEIYIRRDSDWDVPESELTLFINSSGKIQGYTIGNDVSSRSIEGENPQGVFLMTGTCLVPPDEFTLQVGDVVKISIDNIGTLINFVAIKGK